MEKCAYEDCDKEATKLASGRDYLDEKGHPKAAMYCDIHANKVADEGHPEYIECCPHCGCQFGVN